jgi:hypothetical protein
MVLQDESRHRPRGTPKPHSKNPAAPTSRTNPALAAFAPAPVNSGGLVLVAVVLGLIGGRTREAAFRTIDVRLEDTGRDVGIDERALDT